MVTVKEVHTDLEIKASEVGLTINVDKTKILKQTCTAKTLQNITIEDDNLEQVKYFTYLGVNLPKMEVRNLTFREDSSRQTRHTLLLYMYIPRFRDVRPNNKIRI